MKIGILTGREKMILERLCEIINQKNKEIQVDLVRLEGSRFDEDIPYTLIIDRISHLVPYYNSYLKFAKQVGVYIINNPLTRDVLDLNLQNLISNELGIRFPKTVCITGDFPVPNPSARNLVYPLPWMDHVDYLGGFPIIIHIPSMTGQVFKKVITSMNEFTSIQKDLYTTIMLQELKEYALYIRCICVGKSEAILLQNNSSTNKYEQVADKTSWSSNIIEASIKLSAYLDYDFCAIDWGMFGGEIYVLDNVDPMPNISLSSVNYDVSEWCINQLADTCLNIALQREEKGGI